MNRVYSWSIAHTLFDTLPHKDALYKCVTVVDGHTRCLGACYMSRTCYRFTHSNLFQITSLGRGCPQSSTRQEANISPYMITTGTLTPYEFLLRCFVVSQITNFFFVVSLISNFCFVLSFFRQFRCFVSQIIISGSPLRLVSSFWLPSVKLCLAIQFRLNLERTNLASQNIIFILLH